MTTTETDLRQYPDLRTEGHYFIPTHLEGGEPRYYRTSRNITAADRAIFVERRVGWARVNDDRVGGERIVERIDRDASPAGPTDEEILRNAPDLIAEMSRQSGEGYYVPVSVQEGEPRYWFVDRADGISTETIESVRTAASSGWGRVEGEYLTGHQGRRRIHRLIFPADSALDSAPDILTNIYWYFPASVQNGVVNYAMSHLRADAEDAELDAARREVRRTGRPHSGGFGRDWVVEDERLGHEYIVRRREPTSEAPETLPPDLRFPTGSGLGSLWLYVGERDGESRYRLAHSEDPEEHERTRARGVRELEEYKRRGHGTTDEGGHTRANLSSSRSQPVEVPRGRPTQPAPLTVETAPFIVTEGGGASVGARGYVPYAIIDGQVSYRFSGRVGDDVTRENLENLDSYDRDALPDRHDCRVQGDRLVVPGIFSRSILRRIERTPEAPAAPDLSTVPFVIGRTSYGYERGYIPVAVVDGEVSYVWSGLDGDRATREAMTELLETPGGDWRQNMAYRLQGDTLTCRSPNSAPDRTFVRFIERSAPPVADTVSDDPASLTEALEALRQAQEKHEQFRKDVYAEALRIKQEQNYCDPGFSRTVANLHLEDLHAPARHRVRMVLDLNVTGDAGRAREIALERVRDRLPQTDRVAVHYEAVTRVDPIR